MIEIRIHGRGGQGGVTAATILAKAAGYDSKFAQGFGAFGPERRGAPVKAFCRISDNPITIRSHVYKPDYIVVLDSGLLGLPEVFEGVKKTTEIIINSDGPIKLAQKLKAHYFDAQSLAMKVLGKPIVNTAMIGVFAKTTKLVSIGSVLKALEEVFSGKVLELNKKLVKEAFDRGKI